MLARIREKLIAFRQKTALSNKRIIALSIVFLSVIALPLMVIVSQQEQDIRQRASELVSPPLPPTIGFGKAIKLINSVNRDNKVIIQDAPSLSPANQLTVEAWAKPQVPNSNGLVLIKEKLNSDSKPMTQYSIFFQKSFGTPYGTSVFIMNHPTAGLIASVYLEPFKDSGWFHLAMTWDNGTFRVFKNGKLASTQSGVSPSLDISNPKTLSIGGAMLINGSSVGYEDFNGEIDEVRISKIARYTSDFSPLEIPFDTDSDTIALYHFDGNANDSSGNNNNGQIVGDVQFVDSTIVSPSSTPTIPPTATPIPTATPTPVACTACAADVNGSGTVNQADLQIVNRCFGKTATVNCTKADVIKDGVININDTTCVNSNYNKKCVK